jgi:Family of unknown function (DUF6326)
MLLYVYADILSLFRPGEIADIESGQLGPFDVSQASLVIASLIVIVPTLMIVGSLTLRASLNRPVNLILGLLFTLQHRQPRRRELGLLLPVRPARDRAYADDRRDRLDLAPAGSVSARCVSTATAVARWSGLAVSSASGRARARMQGFERSQEAVELVEGRVVLQRPARADRDGPRVDSCHVATGVAQALHQVLDQVGVVQVNRCHSHSCTPGVAAAGSHFSLSSKTRPRQDRPG